MNAINSSSVAPSIAQTSTAGGVPPGEVAFMAGTAAAAAGSVVLFSTEGIKRLSAGVGDAVDAVEDGAADVGHEVMDAGRFVAAEAKKAYSAVSGAVGSLASETEHVVSEAADKVASAGSSLGEGALYVTRQIADAAHYVVAGVSTLV